MSSTWKAAVGVILIFILGWFGGALTTLVIAHHRMLTAIQQQPEPLARLLERETTRNLALNENQKAQLHMIFVDNLKGRMELQKQIQPGMKDLNTQTLQKISAVLSPAQEERFQANLVWIKDRFGRNPFNIGPNNPAPAPNSPGNVSSGTNSPSDVK